MRARDLIKWKRALNEIKFKHEELQLIKEICDSHGSPFQIFLEDYCAKNGIDLPRLNAEKSAREAKVKKQEEENRAIEDNTQPQGMIKLQNLHTPNAPPVEDLFVEHRDQDEMYRMFRDLFKKLALHLHPDRAQGLTADERQDRLSMFKDAKQALDDGDYFLLLDMSERFNIRVPKNFKQQTRWMKARIRQIDQEINSKKNTYNYVFSECETEEEKNKVVKNFLTQIFQI
jgi:hypothetical protein